MNNCDCNNNSLFSISSIERDSEAIGGNRIISRVFGDTLDMEGFIVACENNIYKLVADIIPDQSRIFSKVTLRVDGLTLDQSAYKIHKRKDGMKVISIDFVLDPEHFEEQIKRIDVVWRWSDEDLARPEIFHSTCKVSLIPVDYKEEQEGNGITRLSGLYKIKAEDFWHKLGLVTVNIQPLDVPVTGLVIKDYTNYKDFPERFEVTDFSERLGHYPIEYRSKLYVSIDTLKVQNKKVDLIWGTCQGEIIETFFIDTETEGYEEGFYAPIPVELSKEDYRDVCLEGIYRNFVFKPSFKTYYKGYHELRGKDLKFRTRLPKELQLRDFQLDVLINGEKYSYQISSNEDPQYNYNNYTVALAGVESIKSVEAHIIATYPQLKVEYDVSFSELF